MSDAAEADIAAYLEREPYPDAANIREIIRTHEDRAGHATRNRVTITLDRDAASYLQLLLRTRCGDSDQERYLRRIVREALS